MKWFCPIINGECKEPCRFFDNGKCVVAEFFKLINDDEPKNTESTNKSEFDDDIDEQQKHGVGVV